MLKGKMYARKVLFFLLIVALLPLSVAAEEVNSISVTPKIFDPEMGESVSIMVNAQASMDLYVHVLTYPQRELVRIDLTLVDESLGTYSTNWDGKTDSGSMAQPGLYLLRVFDAVSSRYLSSETACVTIGEPVPM